MGFTNRWGRFGKGAWWGLEHSLVTHGDKPYLERWIVYLGGFTLRLHKFWTGDDARAPHDHPWWFITFPFRGYEEVVVRDGVLMHEWVAAWRPHFRPATYRHIVKMGPGQKPFFTIVISGRRSRAWGFWPSDKEFIYWRDWT